MRELEYPFDSSYILTNKKKLRRRLLEEGGGRIRKRIAILGMSTTHDIMEILGLFLLNYGIEPVFYESEYAQGWNDAMFDNPELLSFKPDIIFIHTSSRNITDWPAVTDSREDVDAKLEACFARYRQLWQKLEESYSCPVIQNNFELPAWRLMGNRDAWDWRGRVRFTARLNEKISAWADSHENFYIHDINYLSASYGLEQWSNPFYYHMYKYILAVPAIPLFSFNLANLIKSLYGKNKKALALDLDNTLWGGIVGDDGADNIEIGQETPVAQLYSEFQSYIKAQKDMGVLLTVNSKNDEENALAGLARPDSILRKEDFTDIKANWESKDRNLLAIADDLNIGADAMVFVDDNPAEREIVRQGVPQAAVPELSEPEHYIGILDKAGYFETTTFSADDLRRSEMYKANAERKKSEASFADYGEYLDSLEMKGEIAPFAPAYMSRIAQLTNKSNQFNLTTRRCSQAEIEAVASDSAYITLYGRLADKFGDNGVVSVVFGHRGSKEEPRSDGEEFHIDLWLMSCRVLRRGMEDAMLDALADKCIKQGITKVFGYYYPTAKNKMVRDFYTTMGFSRLSEDAEGNSVNVLDLGGGYSKRNKHIEVN
ncbi:MAG: HAD family hydrolase [Treponema sp.]|nr:HAD family hydrolase [Treponema sp.]